MSCGLTNETVVHHGSPPPASASQFSNCEAMCGSAHRAWPGPPFGGGKVPPENPHGSSVDVSETCHLPHQVVMYPC